MRKQRYYHHFITAAIFLSVMFGSMTTVWAQEAKENAETPVGQAEEQDADTKDTPTPEGNILDSITPEIGQPGTNPNTDGTIPPDTIQGTEGDTNGGAAEPDTRPLTLMPTMELSKVKDSYLSYEIIYAALSAPEGYAIYYTLDGSEATAASTRYTQPFAVLSPGAAGGSVTLHAIAIRTENTN